MVAWGTRTVIDAVFGARSVGETNYAPILFRRFTPATASDQGSLGCVGDGE
jgi:hypothetical protein